MCSNGILTVTEFSGIESPEIDFQGVVLIYFTTFAICGICACITGLVCIGINRWSGRDKALVVDGFKNDDDKFSLDEWPSAVCTADANSSAGQYPIELQGGSDHNYNYVCSNCF